MLRELLISSLMVLLTVMIHGVGLYILSLILRLQTEEEAQTHVHAMSPRGIAVTLLLVMGLFVLHGVEIWSYAFLYVATGALSGLPDAVYFSTMTYATIGYVDQGLAADWHLVAAIEGINGIILLGWSTAFFVTVVARMRRH